MYNVLQHLYSFYISAAQFPNTNLLTDNNKLVIILKIKCLTMWIKYYYREKVEKLSII